MTLLRPSSLSKFIAMKLLLLFASLVAGTFAAATDGDLRAAFKAAYAKYWREDQLPGSESPLVIQTRFEAFSAFSKNVDKINNDESRPFTAECNKFAILTEDEQAQYLGVNASGHTTNAFNQVEERLVLRQGVPASRDFSEKISGIKDQGSCGSCWTFAATAALEGEMYFKNSKDRMSLSEQEYMECAKNGDGCGGGWMPDCYDYSISKDRIASTEDAPYKAKDSLKCRYDSVPNALVKAGVKVTGNINIRGDDNLLKYASSHIVSVAIMVTRDFMGYKEGVFDDTNCNTSPNHAVAVVGYGKTGGQEYWRVRNSWGAGWGSKGYILMTRERNNICRISSYSHIPRVECRGGATCKKADPNDGSDDSDGSDGGDGGDDSSDGDRHNLCKTMVSLEQKCYKTEELAKKACKDANNPDCAIVKMNKKCFYVESKAKNLKKYIEINMPCKKEEEKCDSAAGLVFCKDCDCCMHKHMCNNPA